MTPFSTRLATCFGIGHVPLAPGTAASLAALPFGWLLAVAGWRALAIASVLATLAGVWACGAHARRTGAKDPSECVIDEVAGQWIALIPAALETARVFDWRPFVMSLFLFRLFDVLKPWPVNAAERLQGGLGIVADDAAAGALAALVLYGMLAIGPI